MQVNRGTMKLIGQGKVHVTRDASRRAKFQSGKVLVTDNGKTEVDVVSVVSLVDGFLNEIVVDFNAAKEAANQAVRAALARLWDAAPRAEAHLKV